MAKILKYKFMVGQENVGTGETPIMKDIIEEIEMSWSEGNEEIAKREAYNGEYEIVDDGKPDPEEQPTQLDVIEAQVTYTAMMTDTLLTGV